MCPYYYRPMADIPWGDAGGQICLRSTWSPFLLLATGLGWIPFFPTREIIFWGDRCKFFLGCDIGGAKELGVIYFPTNSRAKEPQNLPNHRVVLVIFRHKFPLKLLHILGW